ncbi:hypothetical protein VP01_249g2 [Puccinia sorghi]|uniref:Uncharacterized protein n=1 Tax=Puccinia sorghi TaxID=27349 RepID=A0A0L6V6C1_9BASI|nr:hypothetical protein VP01_249g2 [Puccinia sorghi]
MKAVQSLWKIFILNEAKFCVNGESPKGGKFPNGSFQSSQKVQQGILYTGKQQRSRQPAVPRRSVIILHTSILVDITHGAYRSGKLNGFLFFESNNISVDEIKTGRKESLCNCGVWREPMSKFYATVETGCFLGMPPHGEN